MRRHDRNGMPVDDASHAAANRRRLDHALARAAAEIIVQGVAPARTGRPDRGARNFEGDAEYAERSHQLRDHALRAHSGGHQSSIPGGCARRMLRGLAMSTSGTVGRTWLCDLASAPCCASRPGTSMGSPSGTVP